MSSVPGGIGLDHAARDIEAGPSTSAPIERDPEAGAWPEEMDVRFYADSAMTVPGTGSPGSSCGEWYPKQFCDECGEPHFGVSRCEQRTCPNCSGAWSKRRAEKITRRLAAARHAAEDGLDKRAVHAVVSAPEGSITSLTDVYDGYRTAYELAKEKGVRGGVAIFHGYRVKDDVKREYRAEDPDLGIWYWIFEERAEDWRTLTYWSPHWHVIGLSRDFEADDPDEQDGWVARRIRSLEAFQLHTESAYEDMVGVARYLLSHATFESDTSKDCVRWFGDLATASFSPEEEVSEGALSVIERLSREAAGSADERGENGGEDDECEECGARSMSPIWEAGGALMDKGWCDRIGREQQRRLQAAFEWAIGDREPPPGLKHPTSEEEALEAFEVLV